MKVRHLNQFAVAIEYKDVDCIELEANDGRKIRLAFYDQDNKNEYIRNRVVLSAWQGGGVEVHGNSTDMFISFTLKPEGGIGNNLTIRANSVTG